MRDGPKVGSPMSLPGHSPGRRDTNSIHLPLAASASRAFLARILFGTVAILGAAAFILFPAWQLLVVGPFSWHIQRPQTWQGGLEASLLGLSIVAGLVVNRRWSLLVLALMPAVLYARRHAFDIPLLVDILYVEILIGVGFFLMSLLGGRQTSILIDYVRAFVLGLLGWSLLAWSAAIFGYGSIHDLRWLTLALVLPALVARRTPLSIFMARRLQSSPTRDRIWYGVLITWFLVLFARTKIALGYDAQWYGLQGEHVLAPGHSFFESLGLVSPVHYYPKLYEVWLLTVSDLGDSTVITGLTVLVGALLLMVCKQLFREVRLHDALHLPVLALIATLPAFANAAGQPKPDIIATLFILISALATIHLIRRPSLDSAMWAAAGSGLACSSKLTAIPYAGLLVLIAAFLAWNRRSGIRSASTMDQCGTLAMALALPVIALVTYRTWLLSGLPTIGPDPLYRLWIALGFKLVEPAGTLNWAHPQDWTGLPTLIVDWLFRPQKLPHIVITWVGNVWLWLALLGVIAVPLAQRDSYRPEARLPLIPLVALMVTSCSLAIGIGYLERGGDGNYFLFGLIPAIIVSAAFATKRLRGDRVLIKVFIGCVAAFVLFQASYSFISGSWSPGTRRLDAKLSRSPRRLRHDYRITLQHLGLGAIAQHLAARDEDPRVTGRVDNEALFLLPARYEDLALVSYSRPEYLTDSPHLLKFMQGQGIDFLILPRADRPAGTIDVPISALNAAIAMQHQVASKTVIDNQYYMVDASGFSDLDWKSAIDFSNNRTPAASAPNLTMNATP